MYNLHTHSIHSHDGKNTVDELCQEAIVKNLKGLAITDHIDLLLFKERDIYNQALLCRDDVIKAKEKYGDKLNVLFGLELGEEYYEPALADKMRSIEDVDVILGSLHFYKPLGYEYDLAYGDITIWSTNKIKETLSGYIGVLQTMAESYDFDVLSHITYPLRYINHRYKKGYDFTAHYNEIELLLKTIIKREKALELNTSNAKEGFFMPDEDILKMYKALGGKLITLEADSHKKENIDNGLILGEELIKKCGFKEYYYYENRKPKIAKKL